MEITTYSIKYRQTPLSPWMTRRCVNPDFLAQMLEGKSQATDRLILWSAPDEEINNLKPEQLELLEEMILEGDKRKDDKIFQEALDYVWLHKKTENKNSKMPRKLHRRTVQVVMNEQWHVVWCGVERTYAANLDYLLTGMGYEIELNEFYFLSDDIPLPEGWENDSD